MPGELRPSFSVVTGVVTFLALFGFALQLLAPRIPLPKPNSLADERSAYLRQGGHEQIDWIRMGPKAIAAARGRAVPIMLVMGTAWSRLGRILDRDVFSDGRTADYLDSHFVCARVDLDEEPEWRNAFLPLSRTSLGSLPELQIIFILPDGRLLGYYVPRAAREVIDADDFLNRIIAIVAAYEKGSGSETPGAPEPAQLNEVAAIKGAGSPALADTRGFAAVLEGLADQRNGGFPNGGTQRLWPYAWLFEALSGQKRTLKSSLGPVLRTGIVDWLDGGFFRMSDSLDWSGVHFDKLAVEQAAMIQMLAIAASQGGDPLARPIAERGFDSLLGEFMRNGLIRASRPGDEDARGRSERSSFTPREMWDLYWFGALSSRESDLARNALGLDVKRNRQMVVRAERPGQILTADVEEVIRKLRDSVERPAKFAGEGQLDVNGYCAARLIECARLWGDQKRLEKALELCDRLDQFRAADDVTHVASTGDYAYLGDYLAYADAKLQDFLASGRGRSLEDGAAVLRRAMVVFKGRSEGLFDLGHGAALGSPIPELVDNVGESATAQLIRLLDQYGRILKGDSRADGFSPMAYLVASKFAEIAEDAGLYASAFLCATLRLANEWHAFAAGPDAVNLANALYRLVPVQLVAPALGPVRPDIQRARPGIYLVRESQVVGPFSVEEAARRLGSRLSLGQ